MPLNTECRLIDYSRYAANTHSTRALTHSLDFIISFTFTPLSGWNRAGPFGSRCGPSKRNYCGSTISYLENKETGLRIRVFIIIWENRPVSSDYVLAILVQFWANKIYTRKDLLFLLIALVVLYINIVRYVTVEVHIKSYFIYRKKGKVSFNILVTI